MKQNAPQGCAPRGDEIYASHTARARRMRKAHSFLFFGNVSYRKKLTLHTIAPIMGNGGIEYYGVDRGRTITIGRVAAALPAAREDTGDEALYPAWIDHDL